MHSKVDPAILDETRLKALRETRLLDSLNEEQFDRLTDLICKLLKVPVALVSLVDKDRQFFKSQQGLPEPWKSKRETPLSHSFCQHVVSRKKPLIISNAPGDPLVKNNLATTELNVTAYLGMPIKSPNHEIIGSICAINRIPHDWTKEEIDIMMTLAEFTITEIRLRHELRTKEKTEYKLRKANEDLKAFSYMASHDLRAPLSTVIGLIHILKDEQNNGVASDKAQNLIKRILMASKHMSQLISDSSKYINITNEPESISFEHISLKDPLEDAINNLDQVIKENNARISIPEELPLIRGIRSLMAELLQNLMANAIKYCREKPEVVVSTTETNGQISILIKDNGIGISENCNGSIFIPYKRLHSAKEFNGNGLGLAICKKIVQLHSGDISYQSSPGKGSTFIVKLPQPKNPVDNR
ncbi:MAG: ATP-binding protein [Verrucomicrobiota bacterium]